MVSQSCEFYYCNLGYMSFSNVYHSISRITVVMLCVFFKSLVLWGSDSFFLLRFLKTGIGPNSIEPPPGDAQQFM